MPSPTARPYTAFRLNLEQQHKRAKDLLKAARAGEPDALSRLHAAGIDTPPTCKLAQAQHCIARELRFPSWATLKRHIGAMERAYAELEGGALDGDCRTMHIRCGNDIERTLVEAGFHGDFNLHINPYLQGPVTDTADWLERRARFIAESLGPYQELDYWTVLARAQDEERRLLEARRYERVVLWLEHDRYDQFVLLRCLAAFAEHGAPARLELVGPNDFPGASRFVGLGQLPPEALRLLWERRVRLGPAHLALAAQAWAWFRAPDPRALAGLARAGTPLLPDLAAALVRHLQELPSLGDGLGLTHRLLLQALAAEVGPQRAGRLVGLVMHDRDPLPGLGDIGYDLALRELAAPPEPLVQRTAAQTRTVWHTDEVAITKAGREVLAGARDRVILPLPERWVGGVRIAPGQPSWAWNELARDVELR